MPLTFEDREDLYIEIARLRSENMRLEKQCSDLTKERDSLFAQLRAVFVVCSVLGV